MPYVCRHVPGNHIRLSRVVVPIRLHLQVVTELEHPRALPVRGPDLWRHSTEEPLSRHFLPITRFSV